MIGLKDVSTTTVQHGAYITVPAVSVLLLSAGPQVYDITAPDFLCMEHAEAVHALTHGQAATMTPDVWATVRQALGAGEVPA